MNCYGIEVNIKHVPVLDKEFIPFHRFEEEFLKTATEKFEVAVERNAKQVAVYKTFVHGTESREEADAYYIDRIVKMLLWMKGGFKVYLSGNTKVVEEIKTRYSMTGSRAFDVDFMASVYGEAFEVVDTDAIPEEKSEGEAIGKHNDGCRIGFDAGGSDRKVSAVIDGECVFSEEVVWFPKTTADPDYHYEGIVSAMKTAASHMPRVDAIGVSSAGIYIENETKIASLFLQVPEELYETKVRDIYIRAAKEFGDVPLAVANDGDVTALAGAISLEDNNVLGIAMGTSEAVGFVDENGNITGWLNELAFAPVDAYQGAMEDEWSGDIGVGCKYFSQDAVIKLALRGNIHLDESLSLAEKLKVVQKLMESGDATAADVYSSIGVYLAHTLVFYYQYYGFKHVLLLGRVMSGKGGDLILSTCNHVLADEYPEVAAKIIPSLPDEKFRRVGQSATAASLPKISG